MSSPDLLLEQRHSLIRKRLEISGRVLAGELAREFGVSDDTIRRDLRDMAASGLCRRVYGGALPVAPQAGPLGDRTAKADERKTALGQTAARFVEPGTTVFFDAGSTNLAIAHALPHDIALVAATNAPVIATELLARPRVEVILVGGRVDREVGGALGAKAIRDAEILRPDLLVLGACGIDCEAGMTAFSYEDAEFKRFVAQRSRKVLAAVTNDKIATAAPYTVMPVADCARLVVEHDAEPQMLVQLSGKGLDIIHADPPEGRR